MDEKPLDGKPLDHEEHVPYDGLPERPLEEMLARARRFREQITRRRTVREFSERPVPRELVLECVRAAGQAPSGANLQPWHFEVVGDPQLKSAIRQAAEEEEQAFYDRRAGEEWLAALEPLGTDARKPFLETAPWLIVVFEQRHGKGPRGRKIQHYYSKESVGLAAGILIAALHDAGLASLTHTPSPMGFLNRILGRPRNEKPFLLLVVGFPAEGVRVPDISRKEPDEYIRFRLGDDAT